jgi:hypothetical protein
MYRRGMVSWARMKARSASLTLYHFEPGHHKEVRIWHDQDHKPEVVGTTPHIYISQRWVAPPDLMATRPPSSLEHNGGKYVNLYWSSGTPDEMQADFGVLGRRLELVVLYYTDRPDPAVAYTDFQQIANGWKRSGKDFPEGDSVRKLIHSGMYRPSIGHYEFYD